MRNCSKVVIEGEEVGLQTRGWLQVPIIGQIFPYFLLQLVFVFVLWFVLLQITFATDIAHLILSLSPLETFIGSLILVNILLVSRVKNPLVIGKIFLILQGVEVFCHYKNFWNGCCQSLSWKRFRTWRSWKCWYWGWGWPWEWSSRWSNCWLK